MANTTTPSGKPKRNRIKEFFHNALHRINKMKTALALWSRDPRSSRRSSKLPGPNIVSPSAVSPVEHTMSSTTTQLTCPPVISPDPHVHSGMEPFLGPPASNTSGAGSDIATTPVQNGSGGKSPILGSGPSKPAVWEHLEVTLADLEKSIPPTHPLHSVARALLDCLDIFEVAGRNDKIYDSLANELNAMALTLSEYASGIGSEPLDEGVSEISGLIQDCVTRLVQQRESHEGEERLEWTQDQEDIKTGCRRMEDLSRQFQAAVGAELLNRVNQPQPKVIQKTEAERLEDLNRVEGAMYNSKLATELKRHGCVAETRTDVLDLITTWVLDPEGTKVLWMNGIPGVGKTVISYSLCEWLQEEHLLGASYFCTRASAASTNSRLLIPAISYQLAKSLPSFQYALSGGLEEIDDSSSLEPHLQFEKLLLEPLREAKGQISKDLIIVIDGLDESDDRSLVRQVLEQFLACPVDLPIKFFISSRPEPVIQNQIVATPEQVPTVIRLDEVDPSISENDIERYLAKSLGNLNPAPTTEEIKQLTGLTRNLFIYASIIVDYILLPGTEGDFTARIRALLMTKSITGTGAEYDESSKLLYPWYSALLDRALRDLSKKEQEKLQFILWAVIYANEPLTIETVAKLVGIEKADAVASLADLGPVLYVPETGGHVTIFHASFSHFIRNPPESKTFDCKETHSKFLARRCFEVMQSKLVFNICQLETSFVTDSDVFELEKRIHERIPPDLFYACRYWANHLQQIDFSELKQDDAALLEAALADFLSKRLLFWMEVLNLRGCVEIGAEMLFSVRSWLAGNNAWIEAQKSLTDARNFVTRFSSNSCSKSTPHIYISALPACPRSSSVYKNYWPLTQRLLNITGSTMNRTQDATLSRWSANAPVFSLASSFDGATIASGSYEGIIQLWNTHIGTMIGQLIGHGRSVCSIKFSPDGTWLASGFFDGTIYLHDLTTTETEIGRKLAGHRAPVSSLDFSSDSTRIASGSSDGIVRLWDVETGDSINEPLSGELEIQSITFSPEDTHVIAMGARTTIIEDVWTFDTVVHSWNVSAPSHPSTTRSFSGHEGPVFCVDISPDGSCIAAGGSDHTVRLWRADNGNPIGQPLKGHTGEVLAVKFSPDGAFILSGSTDRTVRVWDAKTGSSIGQPFEGHSNSVGAIIPTPNGTRIVSGSNDGTIRAWDADTVVSTHSPVNAHSASVCSVVLSSNSDLIFSGSDDTTVRVWSVLTGTLVDTLIAKDGGSVLSVACSPDNKRYAAACRNGTFLVGDILPGTRLGKPSICAAHNDAVLSVAFSDDGSRLVTSSYDRTIRSWDPRTLEAIGQPFSEHERSVTEVALARRGNTHLVVSGSGDRTLRIYDLETAELVAPAFSGHESSVLSIACSLNGDCIVSGSYDKTIRVWNGYTSSESIPPITGHTGPVRSVALFSSPNGTRIIASGSDDKTVRLWAANTGAPLGPPLKGHTGPVLSVSFARNGKYVVTGSADGEIRLWDIKSRWAQGSTNISQESNRFSIPVGLAHGTSVRMDGLLIGAGYCYGFLWTIICT
ncbi:Apoptotic protease-activating factor 1 [Rhizoctonia solani]|uniref:Apoptotic protease-activating factor 1 n=1 Tax=Rhizoctonia solani TaxID=456999 RepID=A0A0K6FXT0_9AGAM|nr:Apoptotic protease-activating factor 1 [Rhizoctonia solani]